ncbi:hypothetical protein KAR26_00765 [Candidatus Parcubacteria bacterium]|nr:hypothetical protein [Candidatus Parcubacteria bacterium]
MIGFLIGLVTTIATAVAILVLAAVAGFLIVYFYLAPRNYFFTFVKEGSAKAIMRAGKFEKILIQWEGRGLTENGDVSWFEEDKSFLRRLFGGLWYYGFWPLHDVYIYKFDWTGIKENGEPNPHQGKTLDYILVKEDVYRVEIKDAEDKDLLHLLVEVVMPIRIVNPRKALFDVENWLEAVIALVAPAVRDAITQDTYKNHIRNPESLGEKIFSLLKKQIKRFEKDYGVKILDIGIKNIDPPEEYREASIKEYLAEQEKKRIKILAEAQKQKLITEAEGERRRIEKVYGQTDKMGYIGQLKAILESMEKTGMAGVYAVPGLKEFIGEAVGKPTEKITPEDIAIFRKVAEEEIAKSKKPKSAKKKKPAKKRKEVTRKKKN